MNPYQLIIVFVILFSSFPLSFCRASEVGWIQKHQEQLRRFITASFLEGLLNHLRKMDVLSSSEEIKIKEAGRLQDQVNMLTTIVTGKDTQGSDVLRGFIESSDSQVAQLIINHGKGQEMVLVIFKKVTKKCQLCHLTKTLSPTLLLLSGTVLYTVIEFVHVN